MTVKVPADAAFVARGMLERGVSLPVCVTELVEFAEHFVARALPALGLDIVAGEAPEIILTDETLEAETFALIRLNGRVFVPEEIEAAEPERMMPDDAWQDLVERSDRTSPAEYPDMALITAEELEYYMRASAVSDIDPIHAAEVEDDGFVTVTGVAPVVVWPLIATHAEMIAKWRHEWERAVGKHWGDAIAWRTAQLVAERFDELANEGGSGKA